MAVSFLTSKGRIFSNGFVYQLPSENLHDVLIDVDVKMHSELKKYLAVYKLRAKASIRTLSYHAYLDVNRFDEKYQCSDSGIVVESVDPRVPNYGVRVIRDNVDNSCDSLNDEWLVTRDLLWGIGEGSELTNRIPLECNLDLLNYISFNKGCYVGQELTARTRYKVIFAGKYVIFCNIFSTGIGTKTTYSILDI